MPKSGEDEEVGEDDGDDFGGDDVQAPPKKPASKQSNSDETNVAPENLPSTTGVIQHNQGPHPSKGYGASVPVEGKRNEGPTDFNHPASIEPQRIIWLPEDPLGLAHAEVKALNDAGVEASSEHATMSEAGKVDIDSHPPGSDPTTLFG